MQALIFDEPAPDARTSRIGDVPIPEPGHGEVTIDVDHAGVNFIDVMARRGDPGYAAGWPFVPGLEVAGHVRTLGAAVDGLAIGDRVAALVAAGGLAEVAVAKAALVAHVPDEVGLDRGAAAPTTLVTASLLLESAARMRAGETVLMHSAAGGVGQAVARLARLGGAKSVLGTVGSPDRVAAAERTGYDAVFVRGPELGEAISERTGGRGVDVILDPHGTTLLDLDLEAAAPGARIVVFGNASGASFDPLPAARDLVTANASIGGFSLSLLAAANPPRVASALRRVLAHLATGTLEIEHSIVNGLARAPEAQQALAEGRASGKQVVHVSAGVDRG